MQTKYFSTLRAIRWSLILTALVAPTAIVAVSPGSVSAQQLPMVREGKGAPFTRPASNEELTTRLELPEGSIAHPGKSRPLIAKIHNSGFEKARNFGVFVKTPRGVTVTTKARGWKCNTSRTSSGFKCTSSRPLGAEESVEVPFVVRTTKATPPGVNSVSVTPFTSVKKKIESKKSIYTIVDLGDAVLIPSVTHLSGKKWQNWTDGRTVTTYTNEMYTYGIWITNEGIENLHKGAAITVRQKMGSRVRIESAKVSVGSGNCTVENKIISCLVETDSEIKPQEKLAKIEVSVTPTRATDLVALGTIVVKNPKTKAKHSIQINVRAIDREATVRINAKHKVVGEVGASTILSLNLENTSVDIEHKSLDVRAKLPHDLSLEKFDGLHWNCTVHNHNLTCEYGSAISPQESSKQLKLQFHISKKAVPSIDGYPIDLVSNSSVQRINLHVLLAPVVNAEANPSLLQTTSNTEANRVQLDADESVENGQALKFKWIQRCTTVADIEAFGPCPSGGPAPRIKILHQYLSRAHAFIPNVSSKKTFVFEVIVETSTTVQRKTVKVKALPHSSTSKANVDAASVRKAETTTPAWISAALLNAQVTISDPLLSNGIFTATATLPPSFITRFKVPSTETFTMTAPETQGDECIVIHAGETETPINVFTFSEANFVANNFEYVIAPSTCIYGGDTYNGLGLKLDGEVFGQSLTFNGSVTLTPKINVDLIAKSANMNILIGDDSYSFKNVDVNLVADDNRQIATMMFSGTFGIFGTDRYVHGSIIAPTDAGGAFSEGMQVSLSTGTPQSFNIDEVWFRNMYISIGVRYTPKISKFKPLLSINATGKVDFLGASMTIYQMEVDFQNGGMAGATFRLRSRFAFAGISTAQADFVVNWKAGKPATTSPKVVPATPASISVSASAIFVTDSGFSVGTVMNPATLEYRSGKCIMMGGQVIVPGILDATVSGYVITGSPCIPASLQMGDNPGAAKTILSYVPLPLRSGDWRFDASNVKITIAGLNAFGNFTMGKISGIPYGSIDATVRFTSSDTQNTMYVKGSVDPLTGVKLQGEADLRVAGIVAHFRVDAALTSADKYISATAGLSIGSTQFELAGSFGVEKTFWGGSASTASFKASIPNFTIYGYNLGSAQILMDQSAYGASFSASLNVNLGIVNFGGEVSFHSVDDGIALSLDGYGSIGIENQWSAELHFHMSNCGNSECTKTGPLQLTAGGTAYLNSQAFNLGSISFDTGGHFKEQVSRSDEGCYNTGNIKPFGIEFDGCFSYTLFAQISDTAPYISLDADASINVDYRMRHYPCCKPNYWGSWHSIGSWSSGISVQLNPFKLSFSAKIIGIPVHFSI